MSEEKYPTLSFTKLTTYEKCPERYRRQHVVKEAGIDTPKSYFLIGRLAHKIIEFHLVEEASFEDSYAMALPVWLEELGFSFDQPLYDQLYRYGWEYGRLLHRASPVYLKEDKIRKKDGSLLSDPYKYPTREIREAYEDDDLDVDKHDIDTTVSRQYRYYTFISLADSVARGVANALNFQVPDWVAGTESVELDISQYEKIGSDWWHYVGYIDWTVRINRQAVDPTDTRNGNPLGVLDCKTSKKEPTYTDVLWNPQLNLYCQLYYAKFGEMPSFIGLYHLPTGKPKLAEVSQDIMDRTLDHYGAIADRIRAEQFPKRFPTQFDSPCVSRDYKTQEVNDICPYLPQCWPEYYADLSNEPFVQAINEATSDQT